MPDLVSAPVARFEEGFVVVLPASRRLVPDRPIVGVTFRVRDLAAARAALAAGGTDMSLRRSSTPGAQACFSPSLAHGLWLSSARQSPCRRPHGRLPTENAAPARRASLPRTGAALTSTRLSPAPYGVQAVTVTLSRNQPSSVTEQSVIDVKPTRTARPAQPVVPPVAALQAASRSTVVVANDDATPVKTDTPPAPVGGQQVEVVPL